MINNIDKTVVPKFKRVLDLRTQFVSNTKELLYCVQYPVWHFSYDFYLIS